MRQSKLKSLETSTVSLPLFCTLVEMIRVPSSNAMTLIITTGSFAHVVIASSETTPLIAITGSKMVEEFTESK